MAITASNLISGSDSGAAASSFTTASITPSANKLILLSVTARRGDSTQPVAPTVTGNGLTWVEIAEIYWDTTSTSRKSTFLFRAMGASPSSGAVTMDFGTQSINLPNWIVDEITGMDTSGTNGSGAIVQSATNKNEAGATLTVTLAAFSSANNATYGSFGGDSFGAGSSVGTGYTQLGSTDGATTTAGVTEFRSDNDTSVDVTFSTASLGGIAIEIKAASTTTGNFFAFFQP